MFKELFTEAKTYMIFVNERYLQQGVELMNEASNAGVKYQQWKSSDWGKPVAYEFDAKYASVFKKFEGEFSYLNEGQFQSPDKELQKFDYITSMSMGRTPKLVTKVG